MPSNKRCFLKNIRLGSMGARSSRAASFGMVVRSPRHKRGHDKESAGQTSSKYGKVRTFHPIKCPKHGTDTARSRQGYGTAREKKANQNSKKNTSRQGTHTTMESGLNCKYSITGNAVLVNCTISPTAC